jgi:hypothetical protein
VIDRIVELKAETAARAIKIVLPEGVSSTEIPAGVFFQPGLLTVAFRTQEELLERLFLLGRALATKPQLIEPSPSPANPLRGTKGCGNGCFCRRSCRFLQIPLVRYTRRVQPARALAQADAAAFSTAYFRTAIPFPMATSLDRAGVMCEEQKRLGIQLSSYTVDKPGMIFAASNLNASPLSATLPHFAPFFSLTNLTSPLMLAETAS